MEQAMTAERVIDGRPEGIRAAGVSRRKGKLKRTALGALAVLGLAGAAEFGTHYWRIGRFMVSTDDAYVQADNTLIAPRVSGYIGELLVTDNQPVKAGQVLARIDDRDFRPRCTRRSRPGRRPRARSAPSTPSWRCRTRTSTRPSQQVDLGRGRASLRPAGPRPLRRWPAPAPARRRPRSRPSRIWSSGRPDLLQARAALTAAQQQVDVLRPPAPRPQAQLEHAARPNSRPAESRLHDHHRADRRHGRRPHVARRPIRPGRDPADGRGAAAAVYVVANFKETQLTHVRPGQPVDIKVDTFPDATSTAMSTARAGERPGVRPAAARQRHRQLHQDRPAHPGEDRADDRRNGAAPAGLLRPGMSVDADDRHQGASSTRHAEHGQPRRGRIGTVS